MLSPASALFRVNKRCPEGAPLTPPLGVVPSTTRPALPSPPNLPHPSSLPVLHPAPCQPTSPPLQTLHGKDDNNPKGTRAAFGSDKELR